MCYLEGKVLNKEGNIDTDTRLAQWTGADCSQMTCPRGISWTRASGTQDHSHGIECSDMGLCNRLTGECVCHSGFGGIACARSTLLLASRPKCCMPELKLIACSLYR